jgi:hypothetical protein
VPRGTLHDISCLLMDGIYTELPSVKRICEAVAEIRWRQLNWG